jgi:hypothetical protein
MHCSSEMTAYCAFIDLHSMSIDSSSQLRSGRKTVAEEKLLFPAFSPFSQKEATAAVLQTLQA